MLSCPVSRCSWPAPAAGVAALLLALAPPAARAQVAVGVRASTLGVGVEAGYRLTGALALRATATAFSMTREEEVEGVPYELTPRLRAAAAVLDLFPFGAVFHLTGGVVANGNSAEAEAIIGQTITIGNRTYTNTQLQSLRADLDWTRPLAPYLGLGVASGGRVGIIFEAGVVLSGTPEVVLSGETTLTGAERADFDQAVADEEAEIRQWIEDHRRWTRYYPVVALGVRIRF